MHTDDWAGLYREGWGQNRLRAASFAHPAKVSYGLSVRIYEHALEEGWIEPGQIVLDPFAGIGGFALEALRHGLHFRGVELEQRFVDMGQGCNCTGISKADWVRFQGRWDRARYKDGRHWCPQCLAEAKEIEHDRGQLRMFARAPSASYVRNSGKKIPRTVAHRYHGNIETWEAQGMPGTAIIVQGDSRRLGEALERASLCLSSPPFVGIMATQDPNFLTPGEQGKRNPSKSNLPNYGQLAALPEGSHAEALDPPARLACKSASRAQAGAGAVTGRAQCAISSPPFENVVNTKDPRYVKEKRLFGDYGSSEGQLGQETGPTFWAASRQILEQVYKVLAPGGHAIWVLKMFVKSGRLVDFPGQWERLCQSVGFRTVCKHRAWRNKDADVVQITLDGEEMSMEKWYKSFFRHLCEKKGAPRIDWELVLCMEKPQ